MTRVTQLKDPNLVFREVSDRMLPIGSLKTVNFLDASERCGFSLSAVYAVYCIHGLL